MQAKILFAVLASSLVSFSHGAAVDVRAKLDIFDPRIISPNAQTIWVVGQVETVVWDTSDAPINISNGAAVELNPTVGPWAPLRILAGFDLRGGAVNVTVPDVPAGQYSITLYGDSGNRSHKFTVVAPY
ncbi:hypothetical protein FPV67DRAFT_1443253 [Lyophyllum atratum]|nr:hypothetical protein FPV67DRAFT_1443253 [Lyophyllum atratum]